MKLFCLAAMAALCINACHATSYSWATVSKNVGTAATGVAFINSTFGYVPAGKKHNASQRTLHLVGE